MTRMARGYRISDEAKSDLDDIWLYIAGRNPLAADAVIDACFEEFEDLLPSLASATRGPTLRGAAEAGWFRAFTTT